MPPRLAATFQKVKLSAYTDFTGSFTTGVLSADQAVPRAYVDYAIANITGVSGGGGLAESAVDAKISSAITAERGVRETAEAQVLKDAKDYVSGAISTLISGGTATLEALDTINNIYATLQSVSGDSTSIVSGLLNKAGLDSANTFTAANTFTSGLTISGTQNYLYFGSNWRVGGVGAELRFQYAVTAGDFSAPEEIVFTAGDSTAIVEEEPLVISNFAFEEILGVPNLSATFAGPAGTSGVITSPAISGSVSITSGASWEVNPYPFTDTDYTLTVNAPSGSTATTTASVVGVPLAINSFTFVTGQGLVAVYTGPYNTTSVLINGTGTNMGSLQSGAAFSSPNFEKYTLTLSYNGSQVTRTYSHIVIDSFVYDANGGYLVPTFFAPEGAVATITPGNITNISSGQQISVSPSETTNYTLTVTFEGTTVSGSVEVPVEVPSG